MRAQLDHLRRLSELRNITIQILPFGAGVHAGLMGTFTVFRFADDVDHDVVYIEIHTGGCYLEDQSSVEEYLRVFDDVRDGALDPEDSCELLSTFTPRTTRGDLENTSV